MRSDHNFSAFVVTTCFAVGFAFAGYAQAQQAPNFLSKKVEQAPGLMNRTSTDDQLEKYKTAVEELKEYNAALEARVNELERELANCKGEKEAPKAP